MRARLARVGTVAALALGALGCEPQGAMLTVRVQSGLRASDELRYVEAAVYRGSVRCAAPPDALAEGGRALSVTDQDTLVRGSLAVREFPSLAPGTYTVRVQGRRPGEGGADSGPVLVERCVVTTLGNDRVLRVALTTDCINVACPAPGGSPAFTECINGRCVDPRCDPDEPDTTELCCDRALLGDRCDSDPTLCEATSDCEPTLACSGAPSCEEGVCVEPIEDVCPDGEYCDATRDACARVGEPPSDAGALDASSLDAGSVDAAPPDADTLDAVVLDAAVPDAGSMDAPGADAGRDATDARADAFERAGEDCTLLGDEDLDGAADCVDSECESTAFCAELCSPIAAPVAPTGTGIVPPSHWYRADRGLVTVGSSVCAWRDLAGSAHFLSVPSVRPIAGNLPSVGALGGQTAVVFGPVSADTHLVATSDLGVDADGGYTVTVVAMAGGFGGTFLRTWAPATMTEFFKLDYLVIAGDWGHDILLHGSSFLGGFTPATELSFEMLRVPSLAPGAVIAGTFEYDRDGMRRAATLEDGSGLAEMHSFAGPTEAVVGSGMGMRIAEIIVHPRRLTGTEASAVFAYLSARYSP